MILFKRKSVKVQQADPATEVIPDRLRIADMPLGTKFEYLGRQCVVIDYAPEWAAEHLGIIGMEFHYADEQGIIRQGRIVPRNYKAFRSAVKLVGEN